ncbi:MAG: TIGR01777 family protein [Balneolaceae bacterium]|nr:MAG: TIGR01777 family protein [Balneolaceae bacterium]
MVILITGGTGFVGTYLTEYLLSKGHKVRILTRNPARYEALQSEDRLYIRIREDLKPEIERCDVVINLAGENLFDQRWTSPVKKKILRSRIDITNSLVKGIKKAKKKPVLMISASGADYYGDTGDELITEQSAPGTGFLTEVCLAWEEAAKPVIEHGVRLAIPRLGIVLEKDGGALGKMLTPFKLFAGGPLGDGRQYLPWVHMRDVVGAAGYVIENKHAEGVFNLCAPDPVTMSRFAAAVGSALGRPSWIPVPGFALNLVLGEASNAVLASHRMIPARLQEWGYEFEFPVIEPALKKILA